MENRNLETLAQELGLKKQQVETVLELTAEGNTIPFIARYRKEKTGNLDETQIKAIIDMDKSLTALQDRKETVLAKIEAQGKLTDQLKAAIEAAEKLADVEELYLPYKEKRRTKATVAREAGLFPLARLILQNSPNLKAEAEKLISEAFPTADKVLLVLWIFWWRPFLRTIACALGPTTRSGTTVISLQPLRINHWMKKKLSKSTMILRIRFLNFKVTVPSP